MSQIPGQDDEREQVPDEPDDGDDGDENAVEPILEGRHVLKVSAFRRPRREEEGR